MGTDIVQVERIRKLRPAAVARILTPAEEAYCRRHIAADERIAGRFAAKEAVLKALGTGLGDGASWHDIEILPDENGAPHARFSGGVAQKIGGLSAALTTPAPAALEASKVPPHATRCHLSISHQGNYAVAFVVLEIIPGVAHPVSQ